MEKMKKNLISIIIPVYNAEKYINRCINSILGQDYKNYEIILVNDGSSIECTAMLRQLADKYDCIKLIEQSNKGVSTARNNGLKNCSGEWIVFIDADDYIAETFLSTMLRVGQKQAADIVVSEYYSCIGESKITSKFLDENFNKNYGREERINLVKSCIESRAYGDAKGSTNIGVPWAKLYKRSIISEEFKPELTHMEDTIFNINVFMNVDRISYIPEPLYFYEIHESSAVHSVQNNFEPTAQRIVEYLHEFESQYHLQTQLRDTIAYKKFCLYYQCVNAQYIRNYKKRPYESIINMRRISKKYEWDGKINLNIFRLCTNAQKVYGILARLNCYELLYIGLKIADYRKRQKWFKN